MAGQAVNSKAELTGLLSRDLNAASGHSNETGLFNTPLNMDQYKRSSPRNFLINTAQALNASRAPRGRIDIRTDCLVTRIVFAPGTTHAIGVEFLDGESLYMADLRADGTGGSPGKWKQRRMRDLS